MKKLSAIVAVLLASVLLVTAPAMVMAAPTDNIPTLFHNDEAWYKDETAPALLKDGVFHVPSDFVAMFDYITVTAERDGENLLFVNERTGDYVSALYSSRAACVNGEVTEDLSIFRENGYYYLDAEFLCTHLGLFIEYSDAANISDRSVRVYDEEKLIDFADLLAVYTQKAETDVGMSAPEETDEATPPVVGRQRLRIHLICTLGETTEGVLARTMADSLRVDYNLFLTEEVSLSVLQSLKTYDFLGLAVSSAAVADEVNHRLTEVFYRKTHLVLSTGVEAEDELLRRNGYMVLTPDFRVDATTDAELLFEEVVDFADRNGSVTVFLSDVWPSETLILYLKTLDEYKYEITAAGK